MARYIELDAVMAEIERRIESCAKQREDMLNVQCHALADDASARMGELNCLQDFIGTLEVKDVDLDKDIEKEIDEVFFKNTLGHTTTTLTHKRLSIIAKHFFELGLKAQKGE